MYCVTYKSCYQDHPNVRLLRKYNRTYRCRTLLRAIRSAAKLFSLNDCGEFATITGGRITIRIKEATFVNRSGDRFRISEPSYCTDRGGYTPSVQ